MARLKFTAHIPLSAEKNDEEKALCELSQENKQIK